MKSLSLNAQWDIALNSGGNLATAEGAARVAQDVACYVRTFQGEPYYEQTAGVPYLIGELGHLPPAELVTARADRRACEVPGVASASTRLARLDARTLTGTISVITDEGEALDVTV